MVKSTGKVVHRTVAEKMAILAEYEEAPDGQRGAVARRHGIARSTITHWAYSRDNDLFGPSPTGVRVEGRAVTPKRQSAEIARLRRELAKAQADQEILKAALESAGKAHALLEKLAESAEPDPLKDKSEKPQSPNSPTSD
jgi:transposase